MISSALVLSVAAAGPARADHNDFTLERIVGPPSSAGAINDPTPTARSQMVSLMSEMGVVLSPRILTPADTLGWSGFQLAFETSFTHL